ncbi:MAG: hypothetical protein HXY24_10590, partial [Rubrivivax sp.]|nr:hypothetical protein [Rubrivivax sp.]
MKKILLLVLTVIGILQLFWAEPASAVGVLFCRRIGWNVEYDKMNIKAVGTTVDIQGQIAVTHSDQRFF